MELIADELTESPLPGIVRKPVDNPARPKPTYASDDECAQLLDRLLCRVPRDLTQPRRTAFPLLDALMRIDAYRGTDVARELIFIAAMNHRSADERRTAEYILRNRHEVIAGERSPRALLLAARCAAELDVRRVRHRESSLPRSLAAPNPEMVAMAADGATAGELVLGALRAVIGTRDVTPAVAERLLDAVAIALDLASRHSLNGGRGSAILGMRTDARKNSRLVTHLRREWASDALARNVARLLVGPDGTPLETALLFWSVRADIKEDSVPIQVRRRWLGYLNVASRAIAEPATYPQRRVDVVDANRPSHYESGIADERRDSLNTPDGPPFVTRDPVRKAAGV